MQRSEATQREIDHILFELNRCVNDLHDYRLHLYSDDIQRAALSLYKLESLISFIRLFSARKIVC